MNKHWFNIRSKIALWFPMVVLLASTSIIAGCASEAETPTPIPVTVQLKWVHQAQFAGFYVAQDKGFYTEENLAVTLNPGGVGVNIMENVLSGSADIGLIGAEHIILNRSAGKPIKAIATTYRNNPFVLVTLPESGIESPYEFGGHSIGVGDNDGQIQVTAMLKKLGMSEHDVRIVPYDFDPQPFFRGEIDIRPAFSAGSLLGMLKTHPDLNVIWPIDYGIHFYSDTLFATDDFLASNPDLVLRFLRATLKGHQYALENPEEAIEISIKHAADPNPELQRGMFEASAPLIYTGFDEIGWMRAEIWQGMYEILKDQGLLEGPVDVFQIYTMDFLRQIYGDQP